MELRQYYYIVRRWAWLVALGAVLAGGAAYYFSWYMIPVYEASATLRVSAATSQAATDYSALVASQRLAQTYAELLRTDPVLDGVIANLGLGMSTGELRKAVRVQAVRDTELVEIVAEHMDPATAQAIANEIPVVFAQQEQTLQDSRYADLKGRLEARLAGLEEEIQALQTALAARKATSRDGNGELALLESELAQAQASYTTLLQNLGQVELAEAQAGNGVTVAAQARTPTTPVRPKTEQNTLLAAVVGGMLGLGVAFLIEYLDDTLKTAEDIQAALGMATLGVVARAKDGHNPVPLMAEQVNGRPMAEAFRTLRTNIRFSNVDRPARSLVVTSADPGAGKTTTVANLGVVMAQAGQRVVLVDSDLRRPEVHRAFGVTNRVGLTTLLAERGQGGVRWIRVTNYPNLGVISSGPLPPNPSELLGSQRMGDLLAELSGKTDMVILDSPPVLAVTDAMVLSRQVDGVLLVVEAGKTRREAAREALEALLQVGAPVLGVVLNKTRRPKRGYYYDYYGERPAEEEQAGSPGGRLLRRLGMGPGPAAGEERQESEEPGAPRDGRR